MQENVIDPTNLSEVERANHFLSNLIYLIRFE